MKIFKILAINLLILLGVSLVISIPLEIYLRGKYGVTSSLTTSHPKYNFVNKKNNSGIGISPGEFNVTYLTDHKGARVGRGKTQSGEKLLLGLGDSFMFGVGVEAEETFISLLGKKLGDWKVENLGVVGWGNSEVLLRLQEYLKKEKKPDLVVVSFFEGNDFNDNMVYGKHDVINGKIQKREGPKLPPSPGSKLKKLVKWIPFYEYLSSHSAILMAIRVNVSHWLKVKHSEKNKEAIPENIINKNKEKYVALANNLLLEIYLESQKANVPLVFLLIPSLHVFNNYEQIPGWPKLSDVKQFCEEKNLPCVHVVPRILQEGRGVYFIQDRHWRKRGHVIAAEELFHYLRGNY